MAEKWVSKDNLCHLCHFCQCKFLYKRLKWKRRFFLSKITKNESKIIKRRIERIKLIFLFSDSQYWNFTVTFGMIAKWKTSTVGVERCQLDTRNTKKKRQSRVRIQFLAARARLFRTKQTKKEPAC